MKPPALAIVFRESTGECIVRSAEQVVSEFQNKFEGLSFFAPDALPLTLAFDRRSGNESQEKPFFSRQGIAQKIQTILPDDKAEIVDALRVGKNVILAPSEIGLIPANDQLKYKVSDKNPHKPLRLWIPDHFPHIVRVPVRSIDDVIDTIKSVKATQAKMLRNVFMVFRGTVTGYSGIYLSKKRKKLAAECAELEKQEGSVAVIETAVYGRPALFRFVPTKTTLREGGARGLKGNYFVMYEANGLSIYSTRINVTPSKQNKEDYPKFLEMLQEYPERGVYVWAVPHIDLDIKSQYEESDEAPHQDYQRRIKTMILTIYSIRDQIRPAPVKGELSAKLRQGRLFPELFQRSL